MGDWLLSQCYLTTFPFLMLSGMSGWFHKCAWRKRENRKPYGGLQQCYSSYSFIYFYISLSFKQNAIWSMFKCCLNVDRWIMEYLVVQAQCSVSHSGIYSMLKKATNNVQIQSMSWRRNRDKNECVHPGVCLHHCHHLETESLSFDQRMNADCPSFYCRKKPDVRGLFNIFCW